MQGGCKEFPEIKTMKKADKKTFKMLCHTVREDGVYIEAGENDNLIVAKLEENPKAFVLTSALSASGEGIKPFSCK